MGSVKKPTKDEGGKSKFSTLNLNAVFKTSAPKPAVSAGPPRPGLQMIGRVRGVKSITPVAAPKPINLPSLRTENAGLDPNTKIVPAGGTGWGSKPGTSPAPQGEATAATVTPPVMSADPTPAQANASQVTASSPPLSSSAGPTPGEAKSIEVKHVPCPASGPSSARPASPFIAGPQRASPALGPASASPTASHTWGSRSGSTDVSQGPSPRPGAEPSPSSMLSNRDFPSLQEDKSKPKSEQDYVREPRPIYGLGAARLGSDRTPNDKSYPQQGQNDRGYRPNDRGFAPNDRGFAPNDRGFAPNDRGGYGNQQYNRGYGSNERGGYNKPYDRPPYGRDEREMNYGPRDERHGPGERFDRRNDRDGQGSGLFARPNQGREETWRGNDAPPQQMRHYGSWRDEDRERRRPDDRRLSRPLENLSQSMSEHIAKRIQEEKLDDATEVAWAVDEEMDFNEQLVFDEEGRARTIPRKSSDEVEREVSDDPGRRETDDGKGTGRIQLLKRPQNDQTDKGSAKSSPTAIPSSKFKPLGHGGVVVEEPPPPPQAPVEEPKPEPVLPAVVKKSGPAWGKDVTKPAEQPISLLEQMQAEERAKSMPPVPVSTTPRPTATSPSGTPTQATDPTSEPRSPSPAPESQDEQDVDPSAVRMQKELMLDSVERARQRRLEEEQRLEAERKARAAAKLAELDRRASVKERSEPTQETESETDSSAATPAPPVEQAPGPQFQALRRGGALEEVKVAVDQEASVAQQQEAEQQHDLEFSEPAPSSQPRRTIAEIVAPSRVAARPREQAPVARVEEPASGPATLTASAEGDIEATKPAAASIRSESERAALAAERKARKERERTARLEKEAAKRKEKERQREEARLLKAMEVSKETIQPYVPEFTARVDNLVAVNRVEAEALPKELTIRLPGGRKVTVDVQHPGKRPSKDGETAKRATHVPAQFQGIDPELLVGSGVVVVKDDPIGTDMEGDEDGFTVVVSKKSVRREQREAERRRKEEEDEQAQRQREAERSALKDAATTAKPKDVRLKTVSMEKAVTKTTASRNATPAPAAQDTNQAADAGAGATPTLSDEVMAPSVPTENAWAHGAPKLGRETREAPPSNHSPSPNPSPSPSPATDAIAAVLESDDEPEDDVTDGAILTQSPLKFGPISAGMDSTMAAARAAWDRAHMSVDQTAVSPTAGVNITDEEKAEDRLADENDALELVHATTTMLGVTHDDSSLAATLHPEPKDLQKSPAPSGTHTPATTQVETHDAAFWPQGSEAIVPEGEEEPTADSTAAERLADQTRGSVPSRPAQHNTQHTQHPDAYGPYGGPAAPYGNIFARPMVSYQPFGMSQYGLGFGGQGFVSPHMAAVAAVANARLQQQQQQQQQQGGDKDGSGMGADDGLGGMGMDAEQGQYMHLRWAPPPAPGSYRQINPADQQRMAQYMQAQNMAAQARQAIQRPKNVAQPVSPQHSPMAAYVGAPLYSPHIPALGSGMYMSGNPTPNQPNLVSSGKGPGKGGRGYGRQNSLGSGDSMSPYSQYQPWQDGSMMYGPDASRPRDDQPLMSYRPDAMPLQAAMMQQRRAPGAHRPPSGYGQPQPGPYDNKQHAAYRGGAMGYEGRGDMARGPGLPPRHAPESRQPMLPGQYGPPGPIRPPRGAPGPGMRDGDMMMYKGAGPRGPHPRRGGRGAYQTGGRGRGGRGGQRSSMSEESAAQNEGIEQVTTASAAAGGMNESTTVEPAAPVATE